MKITKTDNGVAVEETFVEKSQQINRELAAKLDEWAIEQLEKPENKSMAEKLFLTMTHKTI